MPTKGQYGTSEMARDFGGLTFGNALSSYRIGEEKSQREFAGFFGGFHLKAFVILKKKEESQAPAGQPKLPDNSANQKAFGFSLHYKTCFEKKIWTLLFPLIDEKCNYCVEIIYLAF